MKGNLSIQGKKTIAIDTELSDTSTNPVQNKVLNGILQQLINNKAGVGHTHKIAEIEDYTPIIIDNILDLGSTNPVENGVIAAMFDSLSTTVENNKDKIENNFQAIGTLEIIKDAMQQQINEQGQRIDSIPIIMVDEQLNADSTNPVQNKVIKEYIDDKTKVDAYIDTIDLESENPVQNKVIAARVSEIENNIKRNMEGINHAINGVRQEDNTIFFDTPQEPTAFSVKVATPSYVDNAIGDVETALDNIIAIQNTLIGGDSI